MISTPAAAEKEPTVKAMNSAILARAFMLISFTSRMLRVRPKLLLVDGQILRGNRGHSPHGIHDGLSASRGRSHVELHVIDEKPMRCLVRQCRRSHRSVRSVDEELEPPRAFRQ